MANAEFYVDGVRSTVEAAHAIAASRLLSVSVTHGAQSGSPSIVRIATRGAAPQHAKDSSVRVTVHGTEPASGGSKSRVFEGLIYVDGVLSENATLDRLGSSVDIASVEVFKGEQAARMSTDARARNGIIKVTTRKAAPK